MSLDVFGGTATEPSNVSYVSLSLTANATLTWPSLTQTSSSVVANIMNVTPSGGGFVITMPDATQRGVGQTVLFRNLGAFSFQVNDVSGGVIATVASGVAVFLYLTTNAVPAGSWSLVTFGTGTSSADANTLAGFGLKVIGATLNQKHDMIETSSNLTIDSTYRSKIVSWTAGTLTGTLPTAASIGSDFFFIAKNGGSGTITIATSGGDTIDGGVSLALAPNDAAFIFSAGASNHWYSVGIGRSVSFAFTQLVKSVAGGTDVTLTSSECANKVITLTGLLTANINVIVTNTVSVYYIFNNTTGGFTLTIKTAAGTGFAITQGSHDVVVCDATNVNRAITNTAATTQFSSGSASAPSITFIGDTNTGFYHPSTSQAGVSANGLEVMQWETIASAVNAWDVFPSATGNPVTMTALGTDGSISLAFKPKGAAGTVILQDNNANAVVTAGPAVASAVNALTAANAATGNSPSISATGTDPNISLKLIPKGTGAVSLPAGTAANPTLNFSDTTTGLYRSAANQIGVSVSGTAVGEFDSTGLNNAVIGATTPAAGTFALATANAFVPNSATVPTNGLYLAAANNPAIAVNGSKAFDITTTQATLAKPLNVAGALKAGSSPGNLLPNALFLVRLGTDQNITFRTEGGAFAGIESYNDAGNADVPMAIDAQPIVLGGLGSVPTGFSNFGDIAAAASNAIKSRSTYSAWAMHDNTGAVSRSLNVGSITKNGTGDFTMNITSGVMADGNYAYVLTTGNNGPIVIFQSSPTAPTATALRYVTEVSTTGAVTSPLGSTFAGVIP